jgi:hypothetical protein
MVAFNFDVGHEFSLELLEGIGVLLALDSLDRHLLFSVPAVEYLAGTATADGFDDLEFRKLDDKLIVTEEEVFQLFQLEACQDLGE